jgi:FAD/FMN-containing dehydrogenase
MPAFALPEGIESLSITDWENAHQNFRHRFRPGASFKLRLPASMGARPVEQYRATTANMQWLIGHAIEQGLQLRAMGNGWSFSPVAVCDGGLVDTKSLRLVFDPGDAFVSPAYRTGGRRSADLIFVQCGNTMLRIHELLEARGRCLPASGASNGQTIAGAIATGTHGAAFRFGAISEAVTGMHLVTGFCAQPAAR